MKNTLKILDFEGKGIVFTADGWINATATAQVHEKSDLDNFMRSKAYTEYAGAVARACSVNITDLKKTVTGKAKAQGTFLHPDLVVMFARWISADFAYWCDKQVASLIQKMRDAPALNEKARTKRMEKIGASEEAIAARNAGVGARLIYTNCLQKHGVKGGGFGDCTRAIYFPLFGGSTDVIKQKLNVPEKASFVRDYMTPAQLASIQFIEALAAEQIDKQGAYGNNACVQVSNQVSQNISRLIKESRLLGGV